MEVSIPLDVAAGLSLASQPLTFRATLHVTVLKSAPVTGTGILKTPRRVLFGLHSATMDAAAFRHWAMELVPMAGLEPATNNRSVATRLLTLKLYRLSYIGVFRFYGPGNRFFIPTLA